MNKTTRQAVSVFMFALVIRIAAAVITTFTELNPESQADAARFGETAAIIARGLARGEPYLFTSSTIEVSQFLNPLATVDTYTLWGTFLSPFWLLPGMNSLYARLGTALLGAIAVYNIYLIAQYYHSHHAGVISVAPMLVYPSFVAVHSTLLRDTMILFAVTTAVRFLIIPSDQYSRLFSLLLSGGSLHIALLLRSDNLIIYAVALFAVLAVYSIEQKYISRYTIAISTIGTLITGILALPLIRDGIQYLSYIRRVRASGRTVYLPHLIPNTILEFLAFSWLGAIYFLYAPFPWMIQTIPDLLVGIEGLTNIGFTIAAVWGVRSLGQKNRPVTVGLLVGLVVAVILYGIGTVNYGTGMRHRQMFLWVIFLLGGIGISEHVRFVWLFRRESDTPSGKGTQSSPPRSD